MKILIVGSCRNNDVESKSEKDKKLAEDLGRELAEKGHGLITGGAGGLMGFLVSSYKKNGGKNWVIYLAVEEDKDEKAKPLDGTEPDEKIQTNFNYAVRDAYYIEKCDAVIALSGKALTLAEIIHAVKNYEKNVFQLEIGDNIEIIPLLNELKDKVLITSDIKKGIEFLGT